MKKDHDTPRDLGKMRGKIASADTVPSFDPASRYTVSDTMPIPEVPEPQLPPGERETNRASVMPSGLHERGKLGRFDILDILGQGGMGVVVAAYDPQLDRKVAIKVLRTRGLTGRRREKEAARLLREARTMAQLSHPHVVTVYEAGEIDERVYIAMEYIPGQTLRAWLEEQPRSVPEILEAFVKAGRGLAAGHNAGLIHRDFKPDNVLVGFDGRVRVIDFGLARPTRGQDTPSPTDDSGEIESADMTTSGIHLQLTTAGSLFGTPIYMSPEQHNKERLDGKSDQFSFCVALYEALYRDLPFAAGSYSELAFNVTKGKVKVPADRPDVSKRVADAILRGLQATPDARFPAMDALLDELEPPAKQLDRRVMFGLAGIAAVAIALVVVLLISRGSSGDGAAPCLDGPQRLAGVWDDAVKAKIQTAFRASGRTHADETYKRVVESLDKYAQGWIADRRTVCEATELRREQSAEALDVRMRCINELRDDLASLVTLFSTADAATTDGAIGAARGLHATKACVELMPSDTTQPTVAQRAKLEALVKDRADLRANNIASRFAEAEKLAKPLVARAKEIDHPPTTVDLMLSLGVAQLGMSKFADAERTLREGLLVAARAKDDKMIAQIWTYLIWAIGRDPGRYKEAIELRINAETAIERADAWNTLGGDLDYNLGVAHVTKGETALAIKAFQSARDRRLKQFGEDDTDSTKLFTNLGYAQLQAGDVMAAREAFQKAVALAEKKLGPEHPDTAVALSALGALAQAVGNWDEATKHHTRALKVVEEVHGPEHETVAVILYSLAISANGRKDFKAALPYYQRALAIFEKTMPSNKYIALSLVGIADCLEELGDPKPAVVAGERALSLMTDVKNEVELAMGRFILAKALWAANVDKPRARKLAEQAHAGFKAGGFGALMGLAAVEAWFEKTGTPR